MSPRIAYGVLFERDPPGHRSALADHQVQAAEVRQAHLSRQPHSRASAASGDTGTSTPGDTLRRL